MRTVVRNCVVRIVPIPLNRIAFGPNEIRYRLCRFTACAALNPRHTGVLRIGVDAAWVQASPGAAHVFRLPKQEMNQGA